MNRNNLATLILLLCVSCAYGEVKLELEGDDGDLERNLLSHWRLANEDCATPTWRVRRLFERSDDDIEPALRALGYYRARIDKQLETGGDCWQATLNVDPGQRVVVRERAIDFEGDIERDPTLSETIEKLPLAAGEPLHHGQYEGIKNALRDFAFERGYFDFDITRSELRVDPDNAAADIHIDFSSGPRYRFGELQFGEHQLGDDLIRRLSNIARGEDFDAGRLTTLNRVLSDTQYFRRVEVRAQRDKRANGEVPIDVLLEPAAKHAWRAGLGFATDTGPRASLRYDNRWLNSSGHRFESELRLSPVESGLTADYLIPGRDPQNENYSIGVGLLHEDSESVRSDSARLIGRQKLKIGDWTQTRFIELLYSQSDVGGDSVTSTLLMPGVILDRVQADDILRTRRGYRFNAELRGAYEGLISDATFVQLRVGAKGIHRFGDAGRVTARAEVGVTFGDSVSNLPASIRFFAGGDSSVRGYAFKSLGPRDDNDDVVGGRNLLTGSIEYEHPVHGDDWWVAAFVDAGNAFDNDRVELKAGYGLGVRWYSPVGRLRLDIAVPNDPSEDDWRLHFGLGTDL